MIRWSWKGTHSGQFQQFAATGKIISNSAMAIYEFKDGKIINNLVQTDRFGFLQELGILPADLSALPAYGPGKDALRFIDKFFVPKAAIEAFKKQMSENRRIIKTLPGFVKDEVYEQTDAAGNLNVITVATWQSAAHMDAAKKTVQAEYAKTGFDTQAFLKQRNIKMERGIYREAQD